MLLQSGLQPEPERATSPALLVDGVAPPVTAPPGSFGSTSSPASDTVAPAEPLVDDASQLSLSRRIDEHVGKLKAVFMVRARSAASVPRSSSGDPSCVNVLCVDRTSTSPAVTGNAWPTSMRWSAWMRSTLQHWLRSRYVGNASTSAV